jgi:hypothetical protein
LKQTKEKTMARLSKELVAKREAVVLDFFKANPGSTAAKGQEALKTSGLGGGMMRPKRLYELLKAAVAPVTTVVVVDPIPAPQLPPETVAKLLETPEPEPKANVFNS